MPTDENNLNLNKHSRPTTSKNAERLGKEDFLLTPPDSNKKESNRISLKIPSGPKDSIQEALNVGTLGLGNLMVTSRDVRNFKNYFKDTKKKEIHQEGMNSKLIKSNVKLK